MAHDPSNYHQQLLSYLPAAEMYLLNCKSQNDTTPILYLIHFDRPYGPGKTPTTFVTSIQRHGERINLIPETFLHTYDFSRELLYQLKDPRAHLGTKVYALGRILTTYAQIDLLCRKASLDPAMSLDVLFDRIMRKFGHDSGMSAGGLLWWLQAQIEAKMEMFLSATPFPPPWAGPVSTWSWKD